MGISLSMIEKMQALGLFPGSAMSVLDIGSSNLYSASADGLQRFLAGHGVATTPEITAFAEKLAKGSAYDSVHGGTNGAFVGELLEKAGMKYNAIDIADGYRTTILDLNHEPAPPHFIGAFDLVLNFGTTEHLLNQYNAFKVMHDSAKVGGYIVNSLPGVGYSNHGYFTYTPRCFFDLAGYNEYELVSFWFEGPGGANDLFAPVRDYQSYFPRLAQTLADRDGTESGRKVAAMDLPDVGIVVVYRKVKARPFAGALERSTSVGNVPTSVTSSYETAQAIKAVARSAAARPLAGVRALARRLLRGRAAASPQPQSTASAVVARHDEIELAGDAQAMRERFVAGQLNVDECMQFYHLVVQAHGQFPYDWEHRILLLGLEREPCRADLATRLALVEGLLGVDGKGAAAAAQQIPGSQAAAQVSPEQVGLLQSIATFQRMSLVGIADRTRKCAALEQATEAAIGILAAEGFARLPTALQVSSIQSIYNTTMSVVLADTGRIADLVATHYQRLLRADQLGLPAALQVFDCVYGLYFAGAGTVGELEGFDAGCVKPFEAWLRNRLGAPRETKRPARCQNYAYLLHCAHFDKGNAVSPIIASIARSQAKQGNAKVFLYCVQWVAEGFAREFVGSGVIVREFPQSNDYARLDEIIAQMRVDDIHVAVADLNSAVATYLFSRRCAPVQTWIVMAYPYWSLPELDWTFLPLLGHQAAFGIPADRCSSLDLRQEAATLAQSPDEAALQAAKAQLPEDAFVFAIFSRLIKVSGRLLGLVRRILAGAPRAHVLIVGGGDPRAIYGIVSEPELADRMTFMEHNVDLNVYGRAIDVMLDTFPFHAGNSAREVMIHGKPVLTMNSPEWGPLLQNERDPSLVARDDDDFVAIAVRLAGERAFYDERSAEASRLAKRVTDTTKMVSEIETGVASAIALRPSRSTLDDLIIRNVAGKNGGVPFYPGEPDPMAKRFDELSRQAFGASTPDVLASAESVVLLYFSALFRGSSGAPGSGLSSSPVVRDQLLANYAENKAIATPLFLATRHLIREMYSRVELAEPVLELGMGAGDTAKVILGERKVSVGTTPIVDEVLSAKHNYGNHRIYAAAEAAQIPFADDTFNTVVMNYTFYHLADAAAACREVLRVLAPGGRFHFNLALRDSVSATRVLPRMIEELGLGDHASMARDFVFTDYGSDEGAPSRQKAISVLEQAGFAGIENTDYLADPLSRLMWLTRDLQILFQLDAQRGTRNPRVEAMYREFVERHLVPLVSNDAKLCAELGGTFTFISATKPGSSPSAFTDAELLDRMVCPRSRKPLEKKGNAMVTSSGETAYPICREIPLLIPVYARLWREQNAGTGARESWKDFSY